MATVTIKCDSAPNSKTFKNSASVRVTYETSGGTLKITEIEGKRTDGWTTYNYDTSSCAVIVGGVEKTVSIEQSMFGPDWKAWDVTNTTWSGITYSSVNITVKMPEGGLAHSSAEFKTDSEISVPKSSYTVKYDANGGSGAPSNQTKTYGTTLTLSSTKPTRASIVEENKTTAYAFKGWGTSKSAKTASYQPGGSYTKNAGITLYAVWSQTTSTTYDISYETGTGLIIPGQRKASGSSITLTSTNPSKDGFTFKNWNTKSDGSGTSYASGATFSSNANTTLYAQYTAWTHTVAFNANGGSGAPSSFTKTGGIDGVIPETIPTRNGYVFRYWNTASDASGTRYEPGDTYTAEKNSGTITLYAIWASQSITIDSNKKCKSLYFREDSSLLGFENTYTVIAGEFIEGASSVQIKPGKMYFSEIIEKKS